VVGLDGSCRLFALVATPPQGTALAVLGPVDRCKRPEATFRLREHQGLVPVPLIIAKRLNFLKGSQSHCPSQDE